MTAIFYICTKQFQMKKAGLFIALFVIPIVVYLFFSSGVNVFVKLPVVNEQIPEIPNHWQTSDGQHIRLNDKVTILGFIGDLSFENQSNMTNVSQEVYQKNKRYLDLQVVYVVPEERKNEVEQYVEKLSRTTEMPSWNYIFARPEEIREYYQKLQVDVPMVDANTPYVFIVDKDFKLRGRKKKLDNQQYQDGYLSSEPIEILHNEMEDDLKVVLAEYRLATKKNYKTQESE